MTINLTYQIHPGMFKYPSDPEVEITIQRAKIEPINKTNLIDESGLESGAGYSEEKYHSGNATITIRNHHGTHIDAPSHKLPDGKTINQYPQEKFNNLAGIIDLSNVYRTKERIYSRLLAQNSNIKNPEKIGALIIYTGFCDEMQRHEGQLKGKEKTNFEKKFPFLTENSAKYITEKFPNLNLLGIDSFSVDPSGSNSEVHRILFAKDILPLETLVNLKELTNKFNNKLFNLSCKLLNYTDADAAQALVEATEI
ncbi:hypothetical protein HOE04_05175 [archaeon]|jgi:kynurenine formamidase|nr:hypothetical protein [archaeon]